MTIKELIDKLSEYPDDTDVKYPDAFGDTTITVVCESDDYVFLI